MVIDHCMTLWKVTTEVKVGGLYDNAHTVYTDEWNTIFRQTLGVSVGHEAQTNLDNTGRQTDGRQIAEHYYFTST